MSEYTVRASEIAEYVYCRRAWWLSQVAGYVPENVAELARGSSYHRRHGWRVLRARVGRGFAYLLVFLAVAIFVFLIARGI